MNNQPTPETDEKSVPNIGFYSCATVPAEFARKLERERDEARQKYDNLATEHMLVVNKLCNERDDAREEAVHWKSEWEIVEARLCGWKHPRDNGIIFEHEVIPVLRKERDEAREYSKATWQSLRDSQDEVLRLTFENRELRNLSNE